MHFLCYAIGVIIFNSERFITLYVGSTVKVMLIMMVLP
jgi:hypothetical protein